MQEQWLRTPQAAIACGVSERTLKRLRDEVLEEGVHYQPGFSTNAAITWEIHGVREKLAYRGMIQRKAAEVIKQQLQEAVGWAFTPKTSLIFPSTILFGISNASR